MKRCFSLSVLILVLSLICPQWAAPLRAAEPTPSISVPALLDMVKESEGKVVLINFFAAFCPPCRKEVPGLIRIRSDYPEKDVVMVGVALDTDMDQMEAFIAESRFNYPVFYGGQDVATAFGVRAIPHNVVYSRQGKMIFNESGYIAEEHLRDFLDSLLEDR